MSLKLRLRQWLSSALDPAEGESTIGRRCPLGHWLDPSWTECPRCTAESRAAHRGRVRVTQPEASEPEATTPLALRGVLVTFSWDPRGELFPLREGDSTIGAVATDAGGGTVSDICITRDNIMSGRHARIRCRGNAIVLTDLASSNGTLVDDTRIDSDGVVLGMEARITTGRTVWQFLRVDDPALRPAAVHGDTIDASGDEVVDDGAIDARPPVQDEPKACASGADDRVQQEWPSAARPSNQRRKVSPTRFGDERDPVPVDVTRERPTRLDELQPPPDRSPDDPPEPGKPDHPPRRRGTRFE